VIGSLNVIPNRQNPSATGGRIVRVAMVAASAAAVSSVVAFGVFAVVAVGGSGTARAPLGRDATAIELCGEPDFPLVP
jgi:hypothetical protein